MRILYRILGKILGRIWGGFWEGFWAGFWEGFWEGFWGGKIYYGKWSQEVSFLSKIWICKLGMILGRIWGGFWDGKVHYGKWSQEVSFLSEMWICGPHPIGSWLAEVKNWYQNSSFKRGDGGRGQSGFPRWALELTDGYVWVISDSIGSFGKV